MTVMPLLSLIRYLGMPLITNGVIVPLGSGAVQRHTQPNLGNICACCAVSGERIENIVTNLGKECKEEDGEGFEWGQYILKHELSGIDNNPRGRGSRKWCPCNRWVPACGYVSSFTLGNEVVSRFAGWQKETLPRLLYLIPSVSLSWKNRYKNILLATISNPLPSFNHFCQKHNTNNSVLKNKALLDYDC